MCVIGHYVNMKHNTGLYWTQNNFIQAVPSTIPALKALPAIFILWGVVSWLASRFNRDYIAKPQLSWAWQKLESYEQIILN